MRREISLREIIRCIGDRFQQTHRLTRTQRRVMRAIARCRTPLWADISTVVTDAAFVTSSGTPAATVTVRAVSRKHADAGSNSVRPSYFR